METRYGYEIRRWLEVINSFILHSSDSSVSISTMPSLFQGVYTALFDYAAQSDQELSIKEGDLLYLLDSSAPDNWWSVKKRVLGAEQEEPSGIVPNNYIEKARLLL